MQWTDRRMDGWIFALLKYTILTYCVKKSRNEKIPSCFYNDLFCLMNLGSDQSLGDGRVVCIRRWTVLWIMKIEKVEFCDELNIIVWSRLRTTSGYTWMTDKTGRAALSLFIKINKKAHWNFISGILNFHQEILIFYMSWCTCICSHLWGRKLESGRQKKTEPVIYHKQRKCFIQGKRVFHYIFTKFLHFLCH